MLIHPASVHPLWCTGLLLEKMFYEEWDFWLSAATLLLAGITGWLALETRQMRQGSDKAMNELAKHAQSAANSSKESSDAARASAAALKVQAETTSQAVVIARESAESTKRLAASNEALAIVGKEYGS
jgi:hypothetical protein